MTAAINDATHADEIASPMFGHVFPHLYDLADDLMPDDLRIGHRRPLTARVVEIGMANATEQDVDLHIVIADLAPLEIPGFEWRFRVEGGVGMGVDHARID